MYGVGTNKSYPKCTMHTMSAYLCIICRLKGAVHVYWKPEDSHFWVGLLSRTAWKIIFWEDKWLENTTLWKNIRPYTILSVDTIAMVLKISPPNVTFKRDLFGPSLVAWNALFGWFTMVKRVMNFVGINMRMVIFWWILCTKHSCRPTKEMVAHEGRWWPITKVQNPGGGPNASW